MVRRKSEGFTLIELVVVIIILGILSVIATSQFISLRDDSKKAVLEGLKGTIAEEAQIIYEEAQIKNIADLDGCSQDCNGNPNWDKAVGYFFIDNQGKRIYISRGYPDPSAEDSFRDVFGLPQEDFIITAIMKSGGETELGIIPASWNEPLDEIRMGKHLCHVEYQFPRPSNQFTFSVKAFVDDCK